MSPFSSGTCSDENRTPDLIDLDRYMRGVRPSQQRRSGEDVRDCLVVDGGGAGRKLTALSTGSSSEESRPARTRSKRRSHDSGLSDESYVPRTRRTHRRSHAASASSDSMRAFRSSCSRALREQQRQIARVALLCERLSEVRERGRTPSNCTSEMSSSSRSMCDPKRKDKHRTEECKTYNIIMKKLDEMNRLFAARARGGTPTHKGPMRIIPRTRTKAPSVTPSVSVSDKIVATELEPNAEKIVAVAQVRTPRREIARTCALDIAPQDALPTRTNIVTESVVKCETSINSYSSSNHPDCRFELNDPVHLYAQAKRLQACTRRAHSDNIATRLNQPQINSPRHNERLNSRRHYERLNQQPESLSLCALCRGFLNSLRKYVLRRAAGSVY